MNLIAHQQCCARPLDLSQVLAQAADLWEGCYIFGHPKNCNKGPSIKPYILGEIALSRFNKKLRVVPKTLMLVNAVWLGHGSLHLSTGLHEVRALLFLQVFCRTMCGTRKSCSLDSRPPPHCHATPLLFSIAPVYFSADRASSALVSHSERSPDAGLKSAFTGVGPSYTC